MCADSGSLYKVLILIACDVYEPKELKFSGHFFETRLVSYHFRCDIKELKVSQNASKEAIQALSGTVDLIPKTLARIQENIHVKTNQKGMFHAGKQRSLHESLQEFDMQESFNEHNSIETIKIIAATNCASPKVNNTLSQINTNS